MKAGDILRRAAELVDGDRAKTYGDMAILPTWDKRRDDHTSCIEA